jgi:HupF/HypC family
MFDRSPLRSENPNQPLPHNSIASVCAPNFSVCTCCSDQAVPAKVLALLPGGMASVDLNGAIEEISVELVDSAPGDVVLVHAGVAIARSGR